jgi:hypothetical protein
VPPARPPHLHDEEPLIEPDEIEVDMAELLAQPRVRRRVRITNRCACTLAGDVSTSEPWLWGPVGRVTIAPGGTAEFDIETGVVPVKVTGFEAKRRNTYPATKSAYVPPRRRRAVRPR